MSEALGKQRPEIKKTAEALCLSVDAVIMHFFQG